MPPRLGCWAPSVRGARTGPVAARAPAARLPLTRSRRASRGACRWGVFTNTLLAWSRPSAMSGPLPLRLEPERGGAVAVVEARVRGVVLHPWPPGPRKHAGVQVHVELLLGGVALDVEDELIARLEILGAHLLLQHGHHLGVGDVATVPGLLRRVHAVKGGVRFPGDAERAQTHALVLAQKGRGHVRAVLLDLHLGVDAARFELALGERE